MTYVELLKRGAFPGRVDPFAETGRYFQQIHARMISAIVDEIQDRLLTMGYIAASETSLQILDRREPDINVQTTLPPRQPVRYADAIAVLDIEPSAIVENDPYLDLDAVFIYSREGDSKRLVTVLEIISPRNKISPLEMVTYQMRRQRVIDEQHASFVEIDATRSINRLYEHPVVKTSPYSTIVYPPWESPYIFSSALNEPLRVFGLPVDDIALRIDPHQLYEQAYQRAGIAGQIDFENTYTEAALPFPSLLTEAQRADIMACVNAWKTELNSLKA